MGRDEILDVLRQRGNLLAREIADELRVETRDVNRMLYKMKPEGLVLHDEAANTWAAPVDQQSARARTSGSRTPPSRRKATDSSVSLERASAGTSGVRVVMNEHIMPERLALIAQAQDSVWLSSLTFPRADVVELLLKKAREIEVNLVVASWTCRSHHDTELDRLERAGVNWVLPRSTHSKALVIDEAIVMNGSANAHGGDRDICTVFVDTTAARVIIEELQALFDSVPDSG